MIRTLAVLLLTLFFAAAAPAEPLRVVTTTPFLRDMTQNIGGARVQVDCMVPASADLHLFEPSASDVRLLADADVVVLNGLGLESWIEKLIANSGFRGTRVNASESIESLALEAEVDPDHEDHHHGGTDPHAWMDVRNGIQYAENIRDGLITADPAGKDEYQALADLYVAQLRVLDGWIKREVSKIPPERKVLVTEHATLHYFARAYGFETRSLRGVTTRDEPDAQAMAELIDFLRARKIGIIFAEDGRRPRSLGQLKDALGELKTVDLFIGTLQPAGEPVDSYIALLGHDVRAIVRNLQ